jgi:catalase
MTLSQVSSVIGGGLLSASIACAQVTSPAGTPPSSQELVSALHGVFGKHAGARASHAKGVCVVGHFEPNAAASEVSSADFLKKKSLPLLGRFSIGGGSPVASDKAKTVRGLAFRLGTNDAPVIEMALLSTPVFMVATPEEFVGFMAARKPDPATAKPDPAKVKAFNDAHPSTQAQIAYFNKTDVPASYGQVPYFGVNAFTFTNAKKQTVHGRWRAEPVAGRAGLSSDALAKLDDHFLAPELKQRLALGDVSFDLWLQIAGEGDDVLNPTKEWPSTRREVKFGRISINKIESGCEDVMFNPAQLPAGIAMSEDPILKVRTGAYFVSLANRLAK